QGAAYADLDNDGDLDLVVNNLNEEAFLYRNNGAGNGYLRIVPHGSAPNVNGLGIKVTAFRDGKEFYYESSATRAFCSSVDPRLTIGVGKLSGLDSLEVVWPSGKFQTMYHVAVNRQLDVDEKDALRRYDFRKPRPGNTLFEAWKDGALSAFRHHEN